MKTLLIMRHAKSSWATPSQADHDRPLNQRGRSAAPLMGEKLKEAGLTPDLIICSSAKRAHETAQLIAPSCGYKGEIEVHKALYLASPDIYFETLQLYGGDHQCILMIGHNPTIEMLIDLYAPRPVYITTANIGHIEYEIDQWADVSLRATGRLLNLWRPKEPNR